MSQMFFQHSKYQTLEKEIEYHCNLRYKHLLSIHHIDKHDLFDNINKGESKMPLRTNNKQKEALF